MRVLTFLMFPPTMWSRGGGESYLEQVSEQLRLRGIQIDFLNLERPQKEFDLLHVFGSTHEAAGLIETVRAADKPVVVSPIALSDKPLWAWRAARAIDKVVPFPTQYSYRRIILERAAAVLPSSRFMARQLCRTFSLSSAKMRIVPLGAHEEIAALGPRFFCEHFGVTDFILQVARVNRRKGQTRLLRALKGTSIPVVFIGPLDPEDPEMCSEFLRLVHEDGHRARYLGPVYDRRLLWSAFHAARVHVLPSVGEFPGLVNLEAALAGARIVAGEAPEVREYFGDRIAYCQPLSVADIREKTLGAWERGRDSSLRDLVLREYTWRRTADRILAIYRDVLHGESPAEALP